MVRRSTLTLYEYIGCNEVGKVPSSVLKGSLDSPSGGTLKRSTQNPAKKSFFKSGCNKVHNIMHCGVMMCTVEMYDSHHGI